VDSLRQGIPAYAKASADKVVESPKRDRLARGRTWNEPAGRQVDRWRLARPQGKSYPTVFYNTCLFRTVELYLRPEIQKTNKHDNNRKAQF